MNTIERLPLNIVYGQGSKLIDDEGNGYLDFWGDEGVASMGYCTPTMRKLFDRYATFNIPHRLPDAYQNPRRTEAAQLLCDTAKYDQAFFCNSGAEANEAAIKLARRYWSKVAGRSDRMRILTVEGNFHGRTGYALAASDSIDSPYHKAGYGPTPEGFSVIHDDLDITRARSWDSDRECYYRDPQGAVDGAWDRVAAVIMAPILGNNTVKTYTSVFWERLEALRQAHGFLIIFDEVQVATGRTGTFCAHHNPAVTHGVRPDIVAIGKGIAAGLPAAVVLADDRVACAFQPGVHFSTFGASMIVCQAMTEVIRWWEENQAQLKEHEEIFRGEFISLEDDGLIQAFDGAGVHWGFTPQWSNLWNANGPRLVERAREYRLLMLTHREWAPIRFTPPLNIETEDLKNGFLALRRTLESFRTGKR